MTNNPPSRQGDLDSLCGIYTLVNAMSYLHSDKKIAKRKLMHHLLDAYKQQGSLSSLIKYGICETDMHRLLMQVVQGSYYQQHYPTQITHPFSEKTHKASIQEIVHAMRLFLSSNGHLTNKIIILGSEVHWTLVFKMDHTFIYYYDSSGLNRGFIRHLTLHEGKLYRSIIPHAIYFLTKSE